MIELFFLLIVFSAKHFFADFPLQNQYMLGKFSDNWVLPLSAHCIVHAFLTLCILIIFSLIFSELSGLFIIVASAFDFIVHFVVDRLKVMYNQRTNATVDTKRFWTAIGVDQIAHEFTNYAIIFAVLHQTT